MIYFKTPISSKNSLPAKDNSRSFQIKNTFEIYMPGSLIGRIVNVNIKFTNSTNIKVTSLTNVYTPSSDESLSSLVRSFVR